MNKIKTLLFALIALLILFGCKPSSKKNISNIVSIWQDKEIIFPEKVSFTTYGVNTTPVRINDNDYKILCYIDTLGCTSCKLQLFKWKEFIHEIDSIEGEGRVSFLFFFNSKDYKEISYFLKRDEFNIPVCFDKNDSLNKLNHFPTDMMFQTFLLDSNNRVKIVGNPILNTQIKKLYLEMLTGGKAENKHPKTTIHTAEIEIDLGSFEKENTAKGIFKLKNIGENPLIIAGVNSSCGCISTYYDKHPIGSGDTLNIIAEIKTETEGYFEKTLMVHCNTNNSPITLKIKGRSY